MNEDQVLVADTAGRIFREECSADVVQRAEQGIYPSELWTVLVDNGLVLAGIDEANGGSGGILVDALVILREAARRAVPLPLAETFVASQLMNQLQQPIPALPVTLVQGHFELTEQGRLTGQCLGVPFARHCQSFLIVVGDSVKGGQQNDRLCLVDAAQVTLEYDRNISGEPCDALTTEIEVAQQRIFAVDRAFLDHGRLLGAAARAVMMAGALEEMLKITVDYALERRQFGRAIAKFQAIQQQLAVFAGEVAASVRAADTLLDRAELNPLDVAIAKARIGEASGLSAEIAHQVHGAIGYTREHRLNQLSRRLWLWRDQFGNEHEWHETVARAFLNDPGMGLWQKITELKV